MSTEGGEVELDHEMDEDHAEGERDLLHEPVLVKSEPDGGQVVERQKE